MDSPLHPTSALETYFSDFNPSAHRVIAQSTQGLIVHVQACGLEMAVKTPIGRGMARWLHTIALGREYQAYCRLKDVRGLPACYGLYHRNFLALEYLDAQPIRAVTLDDREQFFRRLLDVINAMHARGVAHGDLKSRNNVMVTSDGNPVIIDLGAALIRRPGWHPINHRLFEYLRRIDHNGWIKLKYRGYKGISPADRHLLDRSLIERITSRLRRG